MFLSNSPSAKLPTTSSAMVIGCSGSVLYNPELSQIFKRIDVCIYATHIYIYIYAYVLYVCMYVYICMVISTFGTYIRNVSFKRLLLMCVFLAKQKGYLPSQSLTKALKEAIKPVSYGPTGLAIGQTAGHTTQQINKECLVRQCLWRKRKKKTLQTWWVTCLVTWSRHWDQLAARLSHAASFLGDTVDQFLAWEWSKISAQAMLQGSYIHLLIAFLIVLLPAKLVFPAQWKEEGYSRTYTHIL